MDSKQNQQVMYFDETPSAKTMQEVFEEMQAAGKRVPTGWMQQKPDAEKPPTPESEP